MFEKLIENRLRLMHSIGAKVVDDTEDFTIPVSLPPPPPPPPEEGNATIISITKPSTFTPGESFNVTTKLRNDGGSDSLFVQLIDKDTGSILKYHSATVASGAILSHTMSITLTQTTDFHGKIEVGHIE